MLYDKDIREPLFDFLEAYYGKIRIIEEKQMGRSRADVVMVTPSSVVGIEIKSDADNPKVDAKKKLSLLWRPELAHIQELNHMPKYRQKSKQFVIEKILLSVPQDILREQISQELFERDYTQIEELIRDYKRKHQGSW